jgi:Ig-like domain from next to BRCA1 gene
MTTDTTSNATEVPGTEGKRGRKAQPPDPDGGPIASFAHELWALKRRAGDPSYATMCTRLGAAASKSSLAAATRGTALPSWETTWEFVRVLAVGKLGCDPEQTRREWLARWTAAGATTGPAGATTDPAGGPSDNADPAQTTGVRVSRRPMLRPIRGRAVLAAVAAVLFAAGFGSLGLGSLGASSLGAGSLGPAFPAPAPGETSAARFDDASFEGDVTFPDGSVVAPGQQFVKVWQLRNIGSVRWEGRYLTRLNSTPCLTPDMVPIPVTDPGRSVRIEVPVTASESPARCKIFWKMTDAARRLQLPDKNPIFLDVVVRDQP